jgi:hypothetical protein
MALLWSSTFTDALGRLTQSEAGASTLAALRLADAEAGKGLSLHRVDSAPGFWTVRVNRDIRIVLHKQGEQTLLAWVGHHDEAYRWAERRRLVPHERTGAMQFVRVLDDEPDVMVRYMHEGPASLVMTAKAHAEEMLYPEDLRAEKIVCDGPFTQLTDDQLLDVGVPRDWLEPVRMTGAADVEELFDCLPGEAAEALLDFMTGGRLEDHIAVKLPPEADPWTHPDAQRRFRVVDNIDELRAALEQPFATWAVFLHPAQRALVERDWTGPARVSGSAGTGKTIVALHRALHLAKSDPAAHVLLTTFSRPLATALNIRCAILTEAAPDLRDRIAVRPLDQAAIELFEARFGQPNRASDSQISAAIAEAQKAGLGGTHSGQFLYEEWRELVDAWNVNDGQAYADVPRIGRRTRLGAAQREAAWGVFAHVRQWLASRNLVTWAQIYLRLTADLSAGGQMPFTHVVVDEAQDLSVAQVRFLAEVARRRDDALFLAGDIGQRIFHLPFSWARLGLDVRGRSHCLKVNYRTSHQIRSVADRLLPPVLSDLDGIAEGRRGTVSVFDGPQPQVVLTSDEAEEIGAVANFIRAAIDTGVVAAEIGVLVRGEAQFARARAAIRAAGIDPRADGSVAIVTMHAAKGLEFSTVVVMACDEDVLPDPRRLSAIGDMSDLEAAYETERHLLYVACTRARDRLMVSGIAPGSEFLDDLRQADG